MSTSGLPSLSMTPSRVTRLEELFRGRDVDARVLSATHTGPISAAPTAGAIMINTVEVIVPPTAQIAEAIGRDGSTPGLEVNSPSDPVPSGMWIWLPCVVVGEVHQFLADLATH